MKNARWLLPLSLAALCGLVWFALDVERPTEEQRGVRAPSIPTSSSGEVAAEKPEPRLTAPSSREPAPENAPPPIPFATADYAVHGRIVDEHGSALAGARVFLVRGNESETESLPPRMPEQAVAGEEGFFLLIAPTPGRYRVTARFMGFGAAASAWIAVGVEGRELGDLELGGRGRLTGVLRRTNGEPVPHHSLMALQPKLADDPDRWTKLDDWMHERGEVTGLTSARTRTDADGRFELRGLAPGRYAIRSTVRGGVLADAARRYETGNKWLELELASRVLRVRVVDPAGRALGGVRVRCGEVELAEEWEGLPLLRRHSEAGTAVDDGQVDFLLPPHLERVGVCVDGRTRGVVERVVRLVGPRTETQLELGELGQMGKLSIRLLAAPGEILPGYDVLFQTAECGAVGGSFRYPDQSSEYSLSFVAGRYHLKFIPLPLRSGTVDPEAFIVHGPVEIRRGEITELDIRPW